MSLKLISLTKTLCICIMILLWSERKLLVRIVFYLSNTVSLVSSLFVFFEVAIVLSSLLNKIIADSAKKFRLRMRSSLF